MARASRETRSKVTIEDVAQRAGVSTMTVSRAVNGDARVHPDTRALVMRAVRELDYRPNLAARRLARVEEIRIGIVYSNPSSAYLSELLVGVLDESAGRGAQIVLVKCEGADLAAEEEAVQRVIDSDLSGVFLPSPQCESRLMRDRLKAAGVCSVGVTGGFRGEVSCVRIDDFKAACEMAHLLLRLGHRRIGFIKGHPNQVASGERLAGFEAALREVPGAEAITVQGYFSFQSGLEAAERLLDQRVRPTAIFASNDDMAAAAVSVAHRRGLDVPKDLTVVGFDDTSVATTLWPALTTVRQPLKAMSVLAIDILLREMRARKHGQAPDPLDRVVPHTIIERQSSAPAPEA